MGSIIETIRRRHSVRNYSGAPVENEKMRRIEEYISSNRKGPLGSDLRFRIVDGSVYNKDELKELGVYGLIKGARLFLAGAVRNNRYAMEDFGYCMEKNILMITGLGLGTCWLGGSLNRSTFAEKLNLSENEIVAAVSPIGYAADRNSIRGNVLVFVMGAGKRKPAEEIFFNEKIGNPLDLNKCGPFATVLECIRWAPSAGNFQPWRIVREKSFFHFYLSEKAAYNNAGRYGGAKLQNIDMGIAMAHCELAASELGLKGKWQLSEPSIDNNGLQYIVSWAAEAAC